MPHREVQLIIASDARTVLQQKPAVAHCVCKPFFKPPNLLAYLNSACSRNRQSCFQSKNTALRDAAHMQPNHHHIYTLYMHICCSCVSAACVCAVSRSIAHRRSCIYMLKYACVRARSLHLYSVYSWLAHHIHYYCCYVASVPTKFNCIRSVQSSK
jgi:hypothetical protein